MAMQGLSMPYNNHLMTELFKKNFLTTPDQKTSGHLGDLSNLLQKISQIHQQSTHPNMFFNNNFMMQLAGLKNSPSTEETYQSRHNHISVDFIESLQDAVRQCVNHEISQKLSLCSHPQLKGSIVVTIDDQEIILRFDEDSVRNSSPKMPKSEHSDDVPRTLQRSSSSKRKNSNPIRLMVSEHSSEQLSPPKTASPVFQPVHTSEHVSQPSSPSADSGVLDLSRATSQAGSAPITPLKSSDLPSAYNPGRPIFEYLQNLQNTTLANSFPQNLIPGSIFSKLPFTQSPVLKNDNELKFNIGLTPSFSPSFMPGCKVSPSSSPGKSPLKVPRKRVSNGPRMPRQTPTIRRSNGFARKFPCNQCNEEFPSLHTLENHTMAIHKGYRCHICQAQFTQRSNLQRHALKHVGFKPFECRVCKKAYYRKDHLIRHMEMGHPGCNPRDNITVHLTSSESLEFLNRKMGEEHSINPPTQMVIDPKIQALLDDDSFTEVVKPEDCESSNHGVDETDGFMPRPRVSDSTVSISQEIMEMELDHSSFEEDIPKPLNMWNPELTPESHPNYN